MVPDVFIYRCRLDTEAEVVKNHLINRGLKIRSVDLKSHKDSATRSFKVSIETWDDFQKLLAGEHIPKCVKVRKYIYFKHRDSGNQFAGGKIGSTSFVNGISLAANVIRPTQHGVSNLLD